MARTLALPPGRLARLLDGDLAYSFRRAPSAVAAGAIALVLVLSALLAPWIAPQNPFDPASLSLMDSLQPPVWMAEGTAQHLLGTDDQGRDVLSGILYGLGVSLVIGVASVGLAMAFGIAVGLASGYVGGLLDTVLMRLADVQISFPAILIALLVDGVARSLVSAHARESAATAVLVLSIALSFWPQFARTVRGSTLTERGREYVQAARVTGVPPWRIVRRHILPNVLGPVLLIATINLGTAIIIEATLSFLGVGAPPTQPLLGTLIRTGNNFLFSGEWWVAVFPAAALSLLVLAVNVLGDWLRDALNPKLR